MIFAAIRARLFRPVETVEQMIESRRVDSLTWVRHRDAHLVLMARNRHRDRVAGRAVLDRVHQQIGTGAAEQRAIDRCERIAARHGAHLRLVERNLEKLQRARHFRGKRHFDEPRGALTLVGPREEQHVVDDPAHAFELFQIRLQRVAQIFYRAVAGQCDLGLTDQNRHRCAQFVRHVCIERLEPAVSAVEPLQCAIEGVGQVVQFMRQRGGIQALRTVIRTDFGGILGQTPERRKTDTRDRVTEQQHRKTAQRRERGERGAERPHGAHVRLTACRHLQLHRRAHAARRHHQRARQHGRAARRRLDAGITAGPATGDAPLNRRAIVETRIVA